MTKSEAINVLQLNTPFVANKEVNEAVEMAINALKKQIAKKPIDKIAYYECPCCGEVDIIGCLYCPVCGQRLNWEDSEV